MTRMTYSDRVKKLATKILASEYGHVPVYDFSKDSGGVDKAVSELIDGLSPLITAAFPEPKVAGYLVKVEEFRGVIAGELKWRPENEYFDDSMAAEECAALLKGSPSKYRNIRVTALYEIEGEM